MNGEVNYLAPNVTASLQGGLVIRDFIFAGGFYLVK